VSGVFFLLKFIAGVPGYAVAASVAAAVVVVFDGLDGLNRRRFRYVRVPELRGLVLGYIASILAMLGVVAGGIITSDGLWEGAIVVFGFVAVALVRRRLAAKICRRLNALGIAHNEPLWLRGLHERVVRWLDSYAKRPCVSLAQRARRRLAHVLCLGLRGPITSARHFILVLSMVAAAVLALWVGAALGKYALDGVSAPRHSVRPSHRLYRREATAADRPEVHPDRAEAKHSPSSERSTAAPVSECTVPPGVGAPNWAHADIHALYLGGQDIEDPPGTLLAGCPSTYHVSNAAGGPFVFTIGEAPGGQWLSIAVDGARGPALFLGEAVRPVLGLIHRLGSVGGVREFSIGAGQFYPVQTDRGTYLLMRAHAGSEAFEVIPPVVTQAWAGAARRSGHFLWPSPVPGSRSYVFARESGSMEYTFVDESPDELHEPTLSEGELIELAGLPE
jgi:hypothetical protein